MGYRTEFKGQLKFTTEMTTKQLAQLNRYLSHDNTTDDYSSYFGHPIGCIDLELTEDFSGIQWDGAEKTYYMEEMIQFLIMKMDYYCKGFGLSGEFECQGEEVDDRYLLKIAGNKVEKINILPSGVKCECPRCGEIFRQET